MRHKLKNYTLYEIHEAWKAIEDELDTIMFLSIITPAIRLQYMRWIEDWQDQLWNITDKGE